MLTFESSLYSALVYTSAKVDLRWAMRYLSINPSIVR